MFWFGFFWQEAPQSFKNTCIKTGEKTLVTVAILIAIVNNVAMLFFYYGPKFTSPVTAPQPCTTERAELRIQCITK